MAVHAERAFSDELLSMGNSLVKKGLKSSFKINK